MAKGNWKPVFNIVPKRNEGGKDYWHRIGTAFENRDGSWDIEIHAFPRAGKIQMRDQDNKYPDRKPHAYDPVDGDRFANNLNAPVIQ